MTEPVVRWTPEESTLFAELARRALVATVDGGGPVRAGQGGFHAACEVADDEIVVAVQVDGERVTLALRPDASAGQRWRDAWALELHRDGKVTLVLTAGAPPVEVPGRTALRLHLRVERRALTRSLAAGDPPIGLLDAGFHRYTRQSSLEPVDAADLLPWASPTAAEAAPWWELDLGRTMYVAQVRLDLVAPPPGARLALHAYGFPMPSGAPAGRALRDSPVEAGQTSIDAGGVIARYLRLTLTAPPGEAASLTVTAAEVQATELFGDTLAATMRRAFTLFADRPLVVARGDDGGYRPQLTYREVWDRAMALARGLARRLEPALGDQRAFVAVMLRNRVEWVMADLAAVARGYVLVPLAPDDPDDRLATILAKVQPVCVICEAGDAARVARLAGDRLRLRVTCDGAGEGDGAQVELDALLAEGADASAPPPAARGEDELYTVLFTSGSTGTPRGAMRSYAAFHAMLRSYATGHSPQHLSFQPLSHLSERMYLPTLLIHGGTVGFSRGGAHLLDELRALAPTTVGSVPRLYEVLYAGHQRRLRAALAAAPDLPRATVEARVLADSRRAFGDRLLAVSVGSAPVGAEIYGFLRRCFADVWVSEGYGSTEVGTIAFDGKLIESVEVQLRPVPGQEPAAERAPERGEIWVRTPHVITGYLGEPAATAPLVDEAGFFATGDLGERDADGRVRVIGRVRNTVKLAQGEFVSAERIETALASAAVVDRVYVHAVPGAPAVAALITPEPVALARLLEVADAPVADLVADPRATGRVLAAVRAHGRGAGLAGYELPRGVLLEAAPLTVDDGRLTASGKLARPALAARHGAALAALAADAGAAEPDAGAGADDDLVARVTRAATRVLGRAVDPREPLGGGLGVDSLAAAEILAVLGDDLGREVPLAWWFEARTLEDLAVRLGRYGTDRPSTAASDDQVAADLALAPAVAPRGGRAAVAGPIRTVLLTGATGFLGAHLVEALRARGLRLVCLVRAPDEAAASARLAAALASRDIPLAPGDELRAVAADLAAPELAATLAGLPDQLDAIVHAGATVSWLASYPALRAPNVLGTLALLELAAARGAGFHHVSTISTAPADGDEDSLLTLDAVRAATPYALSKWVAEQHVRRAAAAGLPVTIHRPAMIAPHTTRGTGNPDDFLSRYLIGLVELGRYVDRDDAIVDLTPVDFVAAAIAALVVGAPPTGATCHLANIAGSLTHAGLGRAAAAAGRAVAPSSYAGFRAALHDAPGSRLRPLASFFPETFALAMGPWPCARTLAALAPLGLAPPRIDDAYVATWLAALDRRGLLPRSAP